ncbi:MAG: IS110 family transposase [Syntrophales bacterium]|nr:IS110 family transposase [Syntrophales bacterium]
MTSKKGSVAFSVVHPDAAGIDIGATFHIVAVSPEHDSVPVRKFRSFTTDLRRLSQWLREIGITSVAMESTGVYWIPVFEILESDGFEVILVNAREVKQVPGRKTDYNDAQWLQKLHQFGLLRASFRPGEHIATLRAYLRHRERLIEYSSAHIQHMQKALMQMNVQLHHVVSDITGATGMRIIRDILDGERDATTLAAHRDIRCKESEETIAAALTGNYREEHVFALKQAVELRNFYEERIKECDVRIEKVMAKLNQNKIPADIPLPGARSRNKSNHEPGFAVRSLLYTLTGVDLTQINGFGPYTALRLIGECGDDMTKWPTEKHFTSWLSLSPGNKKSGGKILSSKTGRTKNRATTLLRIAAVNVGKTETALGAFYRRLAARIGKAKAVIATARKIAILFYSMMKYGRNYVEPGVEYYEAQYRNRVLSNLKKRAKRLGYELIANPIPVTIGAEVS